MVTIGIVTGDNEFVEVSFDRSEKIDRSLFDVDSNRILLTKEDWVLFRERRSGLKTIKSIIEGCKRVSKKELSG